MKKAFLTITVAVAALSAFGVGVAFAQGEQPPFGPGNAGRAGAMHTYLVAALADALDLEATNVEARLAGGETLAQIALSKGISQDDLGEFLSDVHTTAIEQAVLAGALTEEQGSFMTQRMQARAGAGFALGTCPMHGADGFGGAWGGRGAGMMGAGRWQSQ